MSDEQMIDALWKFEDLVTSLRHAAQRRFIQKGGDDDVLAAVSKIRKEWHKLERLLP